MFKQETERQVLTHFLKHLADLDQKMTVDGIIGLLPVWFLQRLQRPQSSSGQQPWRKPRTLEEMAEEFALSQRCGALIYEIFTARSFNDGQPPGKQGGSREEKCPRFKIVKEGFWGKDCYTGECASYICTSPHQSRDPGRTYIDTMAVPKYIIPPRMAYTKTFSNPPATTSSDKFTEQESTGIREIEYWLHDFMDTFDKMSKWY